MWLHAMVRREKTWMAQIGVLRRGLLTNDTDRRKRRGERVLSACVRAALRVGRGGRWVLAVIT